MLAFSNHSLVKSMSGQKFRQSKRLEISTDYNFSPHPLMVSTFLFTQMNNLVVRNTMPMYLIFFAVVVVTTVFIFHDTYDCLYYKKVNGNLSIVSTSNFEQTEIDIRMHVWLQSRLHTANIDVVHCMTYVDTSLGHRLEMFQGTIAQQPPVLVKPQSLWSSGNRNGTTRTMVFSNINYTNVDMFIKDGSKKMVTNCVVDGSVDLFSITALRIPVKKHTFTVLKDWNLNQLTMENSIDQNILQLMYNFSTVISAPKNQVASMDHAMDNPTHSHTVVETSVGNDIPKLDETELDRNVFPDNNSSNSSHHMETPLYEVSRTVLARILFRLFTYF